MTCIGGQIAISVPPAIEAQREIDIASRPAHSNRLTLPGGFGGEPSSDRIRFRAGSPLITAKHLDSSHYDRREYRVFLSLHPRFVRITK
jgi:hypothetical protein